MSRPDELPGQAADDAAETVRREQILLDLQVARRIQQGLLPANHPALDNFDLLAWNQPAVHTGGDYYDWFRLPDGRTAIVIADAVGHGISAAFTIAACRAYVRAALTHGETFGQQLMHINNLLVDDFHDGRFVTAAMGVLDASAHRLDLYAAGQGPIFFFRAETDEVMRITATDLPLGVFAKHTPPEVHQMDFAAGDALVVLTDGFHEWQNAAGESFGLDRLGRLILQHARRPLHDLIAGVHGEVLEFAGGTDQADDLTALVLRCTA